MGMSTAADVDSWVTRYVTAWNTNDAADIGALFTETATYSPAPYQPSWQGRAQIVERWLAIRDEPGETTFDWSVPSVTDDLAVVTGTTRYPQATFSNLWLVRLTDDGECREFSEWWMEHPSGG